MALSTTYRKLFFPRNKLFLQPHRTGYYVLLPEVPQDEPDNNVLLRNDEIPDYSLITREKCGNAILKHAIWYTSGIWKIEESVKERLTSTQRLTPEETFKYLIDPLEQLSQPYEGAWGHVQLLRLVDSNLLPSNNLTGIEKRTKKVLTDRFRSPLIYNICKDALEAMEPGCISEEQEQVLRKYVLLAKLNGMGLKGRASNSVHSMQHELQRRRSFFEYKVNLGKGVFSLSIPSSNAALMQEFPDSLLETVSTNKSEPRQGPWRITLHPKIVKSFLEYCPDSEKRFEVWRGNVNSSSGKEESKLYTSVDLEEIRDKRTKLARHLGYNSHADLVMETKMAGSVDNVISVLDQLLEKARPAQAFEIENLNKFASSNGFHKTLDIWDVPYWKRRQQIASFGFNQDKLRDFFPFEIVLNGMFTLAKKLFSIDIQANSNVPTWHPDVRYYEIFEDGASKPVAGFFLDPFKRAGKSPELDISGTTTVIRNRSNVGQLIKPLSAILCAFSPPTLGRPCLLSFDEVHNLFRNFGHLLHTSLTRCDYSEVSGRTFMDWDAAEVSSEFFGKWVYNEGVLRSLSGHFVTGEPLPKEISDNLNRVRRHMAGYELCRTLYLSRLDIELYSTTKFWKAIVQSLWPRYFVFPSHKDDYEVCSFSDIFSGNWAGAYYCTIWWQLLGADVFSAFQEAGLENDEQLAVVGKRYRETFLASGGGCPSSEIFRRFRGRDLSPTAFLHLTGLQKPTKAPVNN